MTILAFPTLTRGPAEVSIRLRALTQQHSSPFDGTTQTLSLPGARWVITASWPTLPDEDRRKMEAFLAALQGRAGRFFFGPVPGRLATGSGAPTINGAGQSGSILATHNWAGNALAFKAGDFLSYTDTTGRRRLHIATAEAFANGAGACNVPIAPPIRRAGASNAAVEVASPTGVFQLADDEAGVSTRPPLLGSVSLEMVEALA